MLFIILHRCLSGCEYVDLLFMHQGKIFLTTNHDNCLLLDSWSIKPLNKNFHLKFSQAPHVSHFQNLTFYTPSSSLFPAQLPVSLNTDSTTFLSWDKTLKSFFYFLFFIGHWSISKSYQVYLKINKKSEFLP